MPRRNVRPGEMVTFMKHSAVIFDLDGTLLDTLDDLTTAVNRALKKGNYPERTRDEVRDFVGNGIGALIRRAVPKGTTWEESYDLIAPCNEYYAETCTENTKAYDGIIDMLDELKKAGIKIAVVSNKPDVHAQEICKKFFADRIDFVIGEKEGTKKKPAPDMVFAAMEALDTSYSQIVFVGDADTDIQAAKNAGIECISVSWGFKDKYFLQNHCAKKIVDTPKELLAAL